MNKAKRFASPYSGLGCARNSFFLHQELVRKNRDEGGGGNSHQSADDSCECGSDKKSDQDCDSHEVNTLLHNARSQPCVFKLGVGEVEDENQEGVWPGVCGGNAEDDHDGDQVPCYGNDVRDTHENAEQNEVTDVECAKDDQAVCALDPHQNELSDQPAGDALLSNVEHPIHTATEGRVQRGQKVVINLVAFENEVDREDDRGDDIEEMFRPQGQGRHDISGGGGCRSLHARGDIFNPQLTREGHVLDPVEQNGNTRG